MKKKAVVSVAVGVVVMLGLVVMSGCSSNPAAAGDLPSLEGKWVNMFAINDYGYTDFSYTFTGDSFIYREVDSKGERGYSGTFTLTKTKITFIPDTLKKYTQGYELKDNVLDLKNIGWQAHGPFTKQ